jgi:hypothetical protein
MGKKSLVKTIQGMIDVLESSLDDAEKFEAKGNQAASTRVRGVLQDIKNSCMDTRKMIIAMRKK